MGIDPMPLDMLAQLLARIAIAAGEPVASAYARGCTTRWKADGSPVTDADLSAERLILKRLAAAFRGPGRCGRERRGRA